MSKSINRVTLLGTVGKDVELKHIGSGTAVAKFSVATDERYKDKSGEWKETTTWHNVTCWGKLAEIAAEHLGKGKRVLVEGALKTDSYQDKQSGQTKYQTYVNASDVFPFERISAGARPMPQGSYAVPDDPDIPF